MAEPPTLSSTTRVSLVALPDSAASTLFGVLDAMNALSLIRPAASLIGAAPAVPSAEVLGQLHSVLRSTLEQTLTRLGISGEIRVLEGAAARSIIECAEELGAELVVVGTHGRTGLLRFALGSVAERVIRNAKSSVLCVRAAQPPA